MTEETRKLLEEIIAEDVEAIKNMAPDSKERAYAVATLKELNEILMADYRVSEELYESEVKLENETKKLEFEKEKFQTESMLDSNRIENEAAKIKGDKLRTFVDGGVKVIAGGIALVGTRMAVKSDLGGDIISKIGLTVAPKARI